MNVKKTFISLSFLRLCKMYKVLRQKRRIRRWNVRPINKDYIKAGYHRKVFLNMKNMDEEQFFIHTRMSLPIFNLLLEIVRESLIKPRQRIGPEERLSITIL